MFCEEQKGSSKDYWSWRIIDGKKCWYPGRPGKPKSELLWEVIDTSIPDLPSEGEQPEVDSAAPAFDPRAARLVVSITAPPVGKVDAESLEHAENLKPSPMLPSQVTEKRAEHKAGWSWLWIFIPPAAYAAWVAARKARTRNISKGGVQRSAPESLGCVRGGDECSSPASARATAPDAGSLRRSIRKGTPAPSAPA